jgi:maltooligosyltrehalose trehalohydrolase
MRAEGRALGRADADGFFAYSEPHAPDGQRYAYQLDGGEDRPDPCSLWQPDGVFGPSAFVRTADFRWTDAGWKGVRREDLVFYELHVGTFTPQGTFEAVIGRLPELRELGVTAIEIMPVSQFPGGRNWGYDGVLPYAAQNTYGGPRGLARLVDACHAAGLAAFLDVVYNHFGPEGNYLHEFGPYFTDKYKTPWGQAVNYDDKGSDAVRDFVLDNARMWLEEFHLDGLRLDAVHAIYDLGPRHILRSIKEVAEGVAGRTGRQIEIVGESDLNDPRLLLPPERGGLALDAQWSDDFHHALHTLLTGERRGYYQDYGSAQELARSMETPFLFAGEFSPNRGRKHGAPPDGLTGDRFVICTQNHDQIGNRPKGDRLSALLNSPAELRSAACLMLFAPHLPLLFMGEEYGETNPFPFFCSFRGADLIRAVREGRQREFAEFISHGDTVPDADDERTFQSAKVSWSWPPNTPRAGLRRLYADLLAARRQWPALRDYTRRSARLVPDGSDADERTRNDPGLLELIRGGTSPSDPGAAVVLFNLGGQPRRIPAEALAGRKLLFTSESARYAGGRAAEAGPSAPEELLPYECIAFGLADWPRVM